MNYTIIEQQTNALGQTAIVTPVTYDNKIDGEGVFLEKCAAARRSGLPKHSVTLLNDEGKLVARKCYVTDNNAT